MSDFIQYATAADYIIYGALALTVLSIALWFIAGLLVKVTHR
jgi:hypothetical protein